MADPRFTQLPPDAFQQHTEAWLRLAERYRSDPDFRASLSGDARSALNKMGFALPEGVEVRVVVNTADTVYFVMPPDPNMELTDEALLAVAGGSTTGTAATTSTFGSIAGTASTFGTLSTAGTAASQITT